MSPPVDTDYEARLLAAIREPLMHAVEGAAVHPRERARTRRLLAAAAIIVVLGGSVVVWRANIRGPEGPSVVVAPSTSIRSGSLDECAGASLTVTGAGDLRSDGEPGWYLDLRNDAAQSCAVPYPTAATALDATDRRIALAGIDRIAGPGPAVDPGAETRLVLSPATVCGEEPLLHFQLLVVTIGGTPIPLPGVEPASCSPGFGAVHFEDVPTTPRLELQRIDLGGGRSVRVEHEPTRAGSSIGNGMAQTPDGRLLAYEYATGSGREIALVDVGTCNPERCIETRIARGHSPALAADGTLAYVAAEPNTQLGTEVAAWRTPGAITVRAPNGTSAVWARGWGFQTVVWIGRALVVMHDIDAADTEGFEEVFLYRGPGDRTTLPGGLVAVSPDGRRLLLSGGRSDVLLQLYDMASGRIVDSISILEYQRALVPESELAGVDLSRPGHDELQSWPVSCCAAFSGHSLWHDDLVLFPNTWHVTRRSADGYPDHSKWAPTLLRIDGDRIVPLRFLRPFGKGEGGHAERWLPGSTTDFVLRTSSGSSSLIRTLHCRIDGDRVRCADDPSFESVFRMPVAPAP